jgi:cytochrome c biogenesis protein CcmG, thiol:disulfide interchange protein DsbE
VTRRRSIEKRPILVGVAILAFALLAAGCDRAPDERSPTPQGTRSPTPQGTIRAENATEAPLLPTFADELPTMDPDTFGRLLEQLEGTPVLVNFWGSWCPPCKDEMPRLVAAHREFGDRVQFLGVDILESREEARAFMRDYHMTFPSVFDPPDEIKGSLGQFGQPTTIFYRADGTFEFAWGGPISEAMLHKHLTAIAG